MKSCVLIVKHLAISSTTSTKYWPTASTSVNSPTAASKETATAKSSGKPWMNYNNTQCMNVPNLDAISVITKIFNIWRGLNCFNILKRNVRRLWCSVRCVIKTIIELILLIMSVWRICLLQGLKVISLMSWIILQKI